MRNPRETVMQALTTVLQGAVFASPVNGAATWKFVSRKIKLFSEVPPASRPALFITQHDEGLRYQAENLPGEATIGVYLFIYLNGKANTIPATDLNVVLDAIDDALAPDYTGAQTLGSLVSHCRREGTARLDPGDLDGDGLLWVPIRIFGP